MKKAEFEAVLLDCEKLKRLCEERKKCFPCTAQRISPAGAARLQQVASSPGAPKKPAGHPQFLRKFYSLDDLYRIGASEARLDPAEALRHAVDHYRKIPSLTSAIQLEMAINRLT